MEYCGPRGIPHSEFLSWRPDDQAKALGWMAESALRCSGCGTADWEWEEDGEAYTARDYICRGCARTETVRGKADGKKTTPGMRVRLVRNGGDDGKS